MMTRGGYETTADQLARLRKQFANESATYDRSEGIERDRTWAAMHRTVDRIERLGWYLTAR